jgi:hypothetical protein
MANSTTPPLARAFPLLLIPATRQALSGFQPDETAAV